MSEAIGERVADIAAIGNEPCAIYGDTERDVGEIFSGRVQLANNAAAWESIQRWSMLLTYLRRRIPGAEWLVSVDDHEIVWDEQRREFDPTR